MAGMRKAGTALATVVAATLAVVAATLAVVPAATGASDADSAERRGSTYLIEADGKRTKVAAVLRGGQIRRGLILNERFRCGRLRGNFMDFDAAKVRRGKLKDIDRGDGWRDVVKGKVFGGNRVFGKAVSTTLNNGRPCKFEARFTLETVDRKRWRSYSRELLRIDRQVDVAASDR